MKNLKKKYIISGFLLLGSLLSQAQQFSKQDTRRWEDADIDYEIGDYKRALDVYLDLLEVDSNNASLNYKSGVCFVKLRQPGKSEKYLEKARQLGDNEALFYLGQIYHLDGRLEEEIELYQLYKNSDKKLDQDIESVNHLIEQAKFAMVQIDHPVKVDIVNMGNAINTEYHEYVPLVYGAEDEIFFTSRRPGSTGGILDHRGEYFEDIYHSQSKYGFWQAPEQLGEQINTPTHDACVGISSDGQILFVFRTSEDLVAGDLYQSEKGEDGWSALQKLSSDINTEYIETSASISSDDKILYFSSNRPGGFGGMDIYRVVKMPNGEWSKALNLGPTINSEYDEDSPFIHADNKTLYFISRGHESMGGYDIFKSSLKNDGLWSEPENIGYPINTLADDMNFVMSSDKQTGYYSSAAKGGFGGQDLYRINFKLEAQILSVVKGGVKSDDTTHIPVMANITLIDNETKSIQGIYKSNPTTGKFIMVITPESSYQVIVEAEGYHTYSGELYFDGAVGFGSMIEEFKLVPLQVVSNE
jgi:hypothetical protein